MNATNKLGDSCRFLPLWFILKYIKKQKIFFSILMMTAIIWSVNQILFPLILKYIVNSVSVFTSSSAMKIMILLIGLALAWIMTEVMIRMQGYIQVKALSKFRNSILSDVYKNVCNYRYSYFTQRSIGELTSKIMDVSSSSERLVQIFIFNFIPVVSTMFFALILSLGISIILSFAILFWFPTHVLLTIIHIKSGAHLSRLHAASQSKLSGKITDTILNIFNVKLFNRENHEQEYFIPFMQSKLALYKKAAFHYEKMKVFQSINTGIFIMIVMFMLLYGLIHHFVTPGDFALISMLSFNMIGFVWYLSFQMTIFTKEYAILSSSMSIFDDSKIENINLNDIKITKGSIRFKNVDFKHKEINILKNLNIDIQLGEKIGIIGESGSGKSTFVSLIAGIHNSFTGVISIDNQNIGKFSADSLRKQIAYIPQDSILFSRTIMDNIRYGRLNASDKEVKEAAKLAACHEFIMELEQGYDTKIGADGVQLSGGQRQRIIIARAILKDSLIYILDEATSSLDTNTEKIVLKNLRNLFSNRTSIIVSHRLAAFEDTDRIFVFNKGSITETAVFKDLLTKTYFMNQSQQQADHRLTMHNTAKADHNFNRVEYV
ncbi:MAG: hypothetical protein A3F11_03555 [Gammaproteobacteria bacterium RIFCSPHIGHO2_12_FULL_37_14]|nr:MAG: hypothetical protein A3F11_03555 [Gammaproteobacteria bacterium RIFCSPHIGHO2_12_FULL_37_14]